MTRYVIRRILLMTPTMFLVLTLAFFLSKTVPGDAALSMLMMQGLNLNSQDFSKEYQRQYQELGLHKPIFYFSVLPDFYPENIHEIANERIRQQTKAFLTQKANHSHIQNYIEKRNIFISNVVNDSLYAHNDSLQVVQKLNFETDIGTLAVLIDQLPVADNTQIKSDLEQLKSAFSTLQTGKASFYLPKIFWYGTDNQFHTWMAGVVHGQLGISLKDGRLVSDKILAAFYWTFILVLFNILITNLIAIPAGLYAGYKENGYFDKISNLLWLVLYSIPVFWLASIMIVYFTSDRFGEFMNIFPTPGTWYVPAGQNMLSTFGNHAAQFILPLICLAANDIAQLSRMVRNNVIAQKKRLYVTFARSKGLNSGQTLYRHILPNVMIPLITIIGAWIPAGLSGALMIEVIFNIPGMGRLLFDSIFSADWNVVFGILITISFFTILFMLLTDILYALFNPGAKKSMV